MTFLSDPNECSLDEKQLHYRCKHLQCIDYESLSQSILGLPRVQRVSSSLDKITLGFFVFLGTKWIIILCQL